MEALLPASPHPPRLHTSRIKHRKQSIRPLSLGRRGLLHWTSSGTNGHFRVRCASSAIATQPLEPETKTQEADEKFDWFSNWYPLAPVCDLDKRVPHAKRVMGLDVVVWWDRNEERWQVFDDKCPHRLAPLSEGRIDQWGRLQCVYHGWCFDGAGDCKLIPQALPEGPPIHTSRQACVAVYPSCEQNKIVWFWPNSDPQYKDILTEKKPPYVPELDDPSFTSSFGIRDIPYGYEVLVENLMDPAHVPYAHYQIMPIPKNIKRKPIKRDREGGRPLDMSIQKLDMTGFCAKQEFGYSKFIAPCLFYAYPKLEEKSDGLDSSEELAKNNQQQKIAMLIFFSIPVSPGQSRVIWVFPRNFSVWVDRFIPRWVFHVRNNLILDSDLYLLHVEEQKIFEVGQSNWQKACFVPTKSDALVVGFRRWLTKHGGSEVPYGPNFREGLPPTPPREQLMDRYWSHVIHCSSCRAAEKGLKVLEVSLQVLSVGLVGVLAAAKQNIGSSVARTFLGSLAILCFVTSKWVAKYVYKNFHYHDYRHGLL